MKTPSQRAAQLGPLLFRAYRFRRLRPVVRRLLNRWEGGILCSPTWRRIYEAYDGVVIGSFSSGPGIRPGVFPRGTVIGHYSSFAAGLRVLRRNHTFARISQHALFFNHKLGLLTSDTIPEPGDNPLTIGSDVWIGIDAILCPNCHTIGDGAIIGAGSVVTKDVSAYTIVAGNPARAIRKRFSPEVEAVVADSRWWLRSLPELTGHLDLFAHDITEESMRRLASAFPAHP